MHLPELLSLAEIQRRLNLIIPENMENRGFLTREMASRVVYVMLYIGAVEGTDRWLGPKHVYSMTDEQNALQSDAQRLAYGEDAWKAGYQPLGRPWYADTTREPIRDETLRNGFVRIGAVVQRDDIATTSSKPRYAMTTEFTELFAPRLEGGDLQDAITDWCNNYLDAMSLARLALLRQGAAAMEHMLSVTLPNGSVRQLSPGPSSFISKQVIEGFARTYLYKPAVLLLSESGNKIIAQEEGLTRSIGLNIDISKLLPDIILFDLQPKHELLIFVEVVATDGPISEERKRALLAMAQGAAIPPQHIMFVTAYLDRLGSAFRKTAGSIAWGTLVWFTTEPDHIVMLRDKPELQTRRIFDLFYP